MGWGHKLRVWDVKTGKLLKNLENAKIGIRAVRFVKENGLVAYGVSEDGFLVSWDIEKATVKSLKLDQYPAAMARCHSITFTPDCNSVAIFLVNASGHVWDTATGNLKTTLVDSQYEYTHPEFLADNKLLALVDPAKTQVWDIRTGTAVMTSKGAWSRALGLSPNEKLLGIGANRHVGLCDVTMSLPLQDLSFYTGFLKDVRISHNGKVALFLHEKTVALHFEVWDVSTNTQQYIYSENLNDPKYKDAKLFEVGRLLALFGPGGISLVHIREQKVILDVPSPWAWDVIPRHHRVLRMTLFDYSDDSRCLALIMEDGSVNICDISDNSLLLSTFSLPAQEQDPESKAEHSVYYAPNSRSGIFFTAGHRVGLWDVDTSTVEEIPREMKFNPVAAFSSGSRLVYLLSAHDRIMAIWDTTRKSFIKQFYLSYLREGCQRQMALSRNGKYLAIRGAF